MKIENPETYFKFIKEVKFVNVENTELKKNLRKFCL